MQLCFAALSFITAVAKSQGVNLPNITLPISAITKKDEEDLKFALKLGFDWICLSFVQKADDVRMAKKLIGDKAWVISKLEKPNAINELDEIIKAAIPMKFRATGGHPAKKTFQAIRIEVNRELEVLSQSLDTMIDHLKPGGRICIITFHSLEDRIVKVKFKENENPCTCPPNFPVCVCGKVSKGKVITRKPIIPSEEEIEVNKRAKSSKLRIFERR